MKEIEKAFEELALEEDAGLTERLSGAVEDAADEPVSAEAQTNEAENAEETDGEQYPEEISAEFLSPEFIEQLRSDVWEKNLRELSEYIGEGVYGLSGMRSLPNFANMERLMRAGVSPLQAYKAVNCDLIVKNQVQKEKNKLMAKAHLKASGGGAEANEVVVPNDIYRAFKLLEPKITDEEIRRYYKKHM